MILQKKPRQRWVAFALSLKVGMAIDWVFENETLLVFHLLARLDGHTPV
jgi:hypothetical protein